MIPIRDRRGWRRTPEGTLARALAAPAAMVWTWGASIAGWLADRGIPRAESAPIPVVSVGSLTFGGSGKTPTARWIARLLAARGMRPAILLRGYGSRGGAKSRRVDPASPDTLRNGDEAVLLAASVPEALVFVGAQRAASARLASEQGATVAILDDGHQHRRLARALNILLWDASAARAAQAWGLGLREPISGLARTGVLLRVDRGAGVPTRPAGTPAASPDFAVRLVPRAPEGARPGRSVYAITGIADPESFERSLKSLGLRLAGVTRHPDHHVFTELEIADAAQRARDLGADSLATTAKDHVRSPARFNRPGLDVLVFDLDVICPDEESFAQSILRTIERGRA